jgi:DNA primase
LTRQPDLDRLKQDIKIDELARELGLEVKGKQARCFNSASHKNGDKHFSLGFDLATNRFKCFACGISGSVIDLYKELKGVETGEAIRALSGLAGLDKFKAVDKPAGEIKPAVNIKGLYEALRSFCGELDAESLNYLTSKARGLKLETITLFKLFSINDYSKANQYLKDSFNREQLQQAGLISDEGNLIFYKHKVIIPFYEGGELVFLQLKKSVPLFNVDTLNGLKAGDKLYICEGAFDAMTLEQAGFNAIAILGVNNFKPESVKLFKGLDVILCLDNDKAGKDATRAIAKLFLSESQLVKTKLLPDGVKDITELFNL